MKSLFEQKSILMWGAFFCCAATLAAPAPTASTNTASPPKPAFKDTDLFPDTIVAKGKGLEIKRSQLDEAVTGLKSSSASRGRPFTPQETLMIEQQVLDRLIQIQLLNAKATPADKALGKETCDKRFQSVKTRAGSEENLNRQLKSLGMSVEQLRTRMLEETTAEAVVERELNIKIGDADIKKFYDENPAKFEQPEMVRASHILLSTKDETAKTELTDAQKAAKRKKLEDILKRARAGEDFAKLAKEYSEDPGSKNNGGEYTFPRGQMVPEFEAAAFSLNTNQVSDIITTSFGYHIIKLQEKMPAKKLELAKVSQEVRDYLKSQAVQKDLPGFIDKMKKEANVEILDEKLKTPVATFPSPPNVAPPVLPATGKP